ncbi:type II toxin-antitoxin system RelE/ParE family toxin [Chryseosolibacter indicus]|uniref:Type II toxin-antitoxin system RelE/ParE family toxin n=1 Tax=Chryseosolibacter indicus TaxID=2782351 RepID=A0ABS5VYW0_9BACT|nr:type II toxin-antitoxin system RelE/ParE family toxin [Chryseosolibacter indicus]
MIEKKFLTIGDENKSSVYSKRLDQLFRGSIKLIVDFPQIGKPTDDANTCVKIVKDYLIIYEETETQILILSLWILGKIQINLKELTS